MDAERMWDISGIVEDPSVEGVTKELEYSLDEMKNLIETVKEKKDSISGEEIVEFIRKSESFLEKGEAAAAYAYCYYSTNMASKEGQTLGALFGRVYNESEGRFREFEDHLGNVLQRNPEIINEPVLKEYRHYLEIPLRRVSYRLSPLVEQVILDKDSNGIFALTQLRESIVGNKVVDIQIKGEAQILTQNNLFSLLMDEDRDTRRVVSESYFGSFAEDKLIHGTTLRANCSDHYKMFKTRNQPSPMTESLITQDMDELTITTLLSTIKKTSSSYRKYLKTKSAYFKQEKLPGYDIRAPWSSSTFWDADWNKVKSLVLQAYSNFDEEVGEMLKGLFTNNRVDSLDRPGRMATAFAFPYYKDRTAYVFLSYNGTLNDAYIVAHELGHAVHGLLMYKHLSLANCNLSSCMAETASIFGELLLTDELLRTFQTPEAQLEILAKVLDRFYTWGYHTGAYSLFELGLYEALESGEFIDADFACNLWKNTLSEMIGECIEWTKNLEYEWARWNQFFDPHYRFYTHSYTFAQMLVFALYDDFKSGDTDFNKRFKKLLSRGSSMSPKDQISELGYDISKPDFWVRGTKQAEQFLEKLKKLI